jgi:hypothetical protein
VAIHLKTAGSSLTNGCVPSVQIFLTAFFTSQPSFNLKVASFMDAPNYENVKNLNRQTIMHDSPD